jgi:magnesium chelatase accessory protein
LYLLVCANDQAVAPAQARRLARRIPGARLQELPGLGHLGHEENPALFAQLIRDIAVEQGLLRPAAD